jgi:hypothetical protein
MDFHFAHAVHLGEIPNFEKRHYPCLLECRERQMGVQRQTAGCRENSEVNDPAGAYLMNAIRVVRVVCGSSLVRNVVP